MNNINAIQVMVKGCCKCCGASFEEMVTVGAASVSLSPATPMQVVAPSMAIPKRLPGVTANDVLEIVTKATGHKAGIVRGSDRRSDIALARHLFAWVLQKKLGYSWARTAEAAGYKEHTAAMHAVNRLQFELDRFGIYDVGENWFTQEHGKPKEMNAPQLLADLASIYSVLLAA